MNELTKVESQIPAAPCRPNGVVVIETSSQAVITRTEAADDSVQALRVKMDTAVYQYAIASLNDQTAEKNKTAAEKQLSQAFAEAETEAVKKGVGLFLLYQFGQSVRGVVKGFGSVWKALTYWLHIDDVSKKAH